MVSYGKAAIWSGISAVIGGGLNILLQKRKGRVSNDELLDDPEDFERSPTYRPFESGTIPSQYPGLTVEPEETVD